MRTYYLLESNLKTLDIAMRVSGESDMSTHVCKVMPKTNILVLEALDYCDFPFHCVLDMSFRAWRSYEDLRGD